MYLTRAQAVGLYGVAMNAPTDATFEMSLPDHKGHVVVKITHLDANANGFEKTVKLLKQGGVETISEHALSKPLEEAVPNEEAPASAR